MRLNPIKFFSPTILSMYSIVFKGAHTASKTFICFVQLFVPILKMKSIQGS